MEIGCGLLRVDVVPGGTGWIWTRRMEEEESVRGVWRNGVVLVMMASPRGERRQPRWGSSRGFVLDVACQHGDVH